MSHPRTRPRGLVRAAIWLAAIVAAGVGAIVVALPSQAAGPLRTVTPAGKFIGYAGAFDLLCNSQVACTSGSNPTYRSLAGTEFNQVTPENGMKWENTEPNPGMFTFTQGDAIVNFATANNQIVHGHTLLWHSQTPQWVQNLSGQAMRDALRNHIMML